MDTKITSLVLTVYVKNRLLFGPQQKFLIAMLKQLIGVSFFKYAIESHKQL